MSKGDRMLGWVKLHRQTADRGHFHMPDICFKIWIYCLLKAQPFAGEKKSAGSLVLTYGEIQRNLCQPGRVTSKSTIAAALRFLQERGYLFIQRSQRGLKVTVVNWQKYQEEQLAETAPDLVEDPIAVAEEETTSTPVVQEDFQDFYRCTSAISQAANTGTPTVQQESSGLLDVQQRTTKCTPTVQQEEPAVHQQYYGSTHSVHLKALRCTVDVPMKVAQPKKDEASEVPKNILKNDQELKDRGITPQTPLSGGKATTEEEVFALFARYNHKQKGTLCEYWKKIGHNRKGNPLSTASINEYMSQWEHYPVEVVLEAMELHLQRYPDKRVSYTAGIMRRMVAEQITKNVQFPGGECFGQVGSSAQSHPIYGAPSRFAHLLR